MKVEGDDVMKVNYKHSHAPGQINMISLLDFFRDPLSVCPLLRDTFSRGTMPGALFQGALHVVQGHSIRLPHYVSGLRLISL